MLNMQNVKDIEITEGDVRTIHDKDNKLIWGRLAYDTKYDGNTDQQTYSGKNLSSYAIYDAEDGRILNMPDLILAAGTYTISFDLDSFELGTNSTMSLYMSLFNSSGTNVTGDKNLLTIASDTSLSRYNYTFEASEEVHYATSQIRITTNAYNNGGRCKISNIQIEAGSTATAFEPYVGGVPAPNPNYPQDINVVSGTQTVTVSDGVDSEDYIISLGSTELCKIGTYQDYIYKGGDDWYVHKTINKIVLDGTEETWYQWNYSSAFITVLDAINPSTRTTGIVMSDRFIEGASTTQGSQWNDFPNGTVAIRQFTDQPKIGFKTDVANDLVTWKTWLTTHNTTVYYVLATPTNTQITDATLISQLDAIHQFLTRYGYNSSVTGNLPLIINQTSL